MRISDQSEAIGRKEVDKDPQLVGRMTLVIIILIVTAAPFSFTIGRLAMKNMRASIDFDKNVAIFRSGEQLVTVQLWTDREQHGCSLTE